jgi:hypothetical protein
LVVSAALTVREQRHLRDAQAEIARLHEFQRVHVAVSQEVTHLGADPSPDPEGRADTEKQINLLIGLTVSRKTIEKLSAVRVRLELIDTGGAVQFAEGTALLAEAESAEQEHQATVLAKLQRQNIAQPQLELAAPVAVLAISVLLLPLARRRIIKPLDASASACRAWPTAIFRPRRSTTSIRSCCRSTSSSTPSRRASRSSRRRTARAPVTAGSGRRRDAEGARATARALPRRAPLRHRRAGGLGRARAAQPLAGIQVTLANLRADLGDGDAGERIDLVLNEVSRLTRLLNCPRLGPSPPRAAARVRLAPLVDELLSLTRPQLPDAVRVETQVDPSLTCRVPPIACARRCSTSCSIPAPRSAKGGAIRINAAPAGDRVQLSVADDGPGFRRKSSRTASAPSAARVSTAPASACRWCGASRVKWAASWRWRTASRTAPKAVLLFVMRTSTCSHPAAPAASRAASVVRRRSISSNQSSR